jgi:uncharacterized protein YdeI (BOF family)
MRRTGFSTAAGIAALAMAAMLAQAAAAQDLTNIAELRRGMAASVQGVVDRLSDDDEFRIADDTGAVRVYIGPNPMPVAVGDTVTVHGMMDDDIGRLELYARQIVLADGTIILLRQDY